MKNNRSLKKPIPERVELERDPKIIYLFVEGAKREQQYFGFLNKRSSKLKLEIYKIQNETDNSPLGLYKLANYSIKSSTNLDGKYEISEIDEVWIVLDTDLEIENPNLQVIENKKEMLLSIRQKCQEQGWNIAQSNPCFEVWLYYHKNINPPIFSAEQNIELPNDWKNLVSSFDTKTHIYENSAFLTAITNAKAIFERDENGMPKPATTEVFLLAEKIYPFIKENLAKFAVEKEKFNQNLKDSL